MIHVRSHKRRVASGREVSVIAHEREGGGGGDIVRPAPEWSQPEYVGDIPPVPVSQPADSDWWIEDDSGQPEQSLQEAQNERIRAASASRMQAEAAETARQRQIWDNRPRRE